MRLSDGKLRKLQVDRGGSVDIGGQIVTAAMANESAEGLKLAAYSHHVSGDPTTRSAVGID
jgi:hypothetical protein